MRRSAAPRLRAGTVLMAAQDAASLLEARVQLDPDKELFRFIRTGERLSYGAFDAACNSVANGLRRNGVCHGDLVLQMLRPCREMLTASYALRKLGAVEVPLNTEFRGPPLARMINLTKSTIMVTSTEMLPALREVGSELVHLKTIFLVNGPVEAGAEVCDGARAALFAELEAERPVRPSRDVTETDVASLCFTSGTTGVSKACMLTHRYGHFVVKSLVDACSLTSEDRVYTFWPLYHYAGSILDVQAAIAVGGSVVSVPKFSASKFFDEVADSAATWYQVMGNVASIIESLPRHPREGAHQLRFVWGGPLPKDIQAFERRFGCQVLPGGGYGSTDAGTVALPSLGEDLPSPQCAGHPLPTHEVQIVDQADEIVPHGTDGEIVVRPRVPYVMSTGYFGMPEATCASQRNLWFHTGDLGRMDEQGRLYLLSRLGERLRRKGENISVVEIEELISQHEAVENVCVVGVPDELGEDELYVFVDCPVEAAVTEAELLQWCEAALPRFMMPRRIAVLRRLPRTPTHKIARGDLARRAREIAGQASARDGSYVDMEALAPAADKQ